MVEVELDNNNKLSQRASEKSYLLPELMTSHRRWMYGTESEIKWNQLLVSQTESIP